MIIELAPFAYEVFYYQFCRLLKIKLAIIGGDKRNAESGSF